MRKELNALRISQDHAQLLMETLQHVRDQAKIVRQGLDGAHVCQAASRQLATLILEACKVLTIVTNAGTTDNPAPVPTTPPIWAMVRDTNHADTTGLSQRQRQILDYIRNHIETRGYPPTVRDIGLAMGIGSPNGVLCHLKALEKKGCIARSHNRSRGLKLLI
jgi:LexA DNA binding domain